MYVEHAPTSNFNLNVQWYICSFEVGAPQSLQHHTIHTELSSPV